MQKVFRGDLKGENTAELLLCQADYAAGAGYVASERFAGRLAGKEGTFVLQHGRLSGDGDERTFGYVVPGSGTGGLAGFRGQAVIGRDAEGKHTLILDYDFA